MICASSKNLRNMSMSGGMGTALFVVSVGSMRYVLPFIACLYSKNSISALSSVSSSNEYKKSPIYTRTGDAGTSSLYNGERRIKADDVFHALGHQDELNAVIGIAVEYCRTSNNNLEDRLIEIQSRLFDLGAAVATPLQSSSETKVLYTKFPAEHTKLLERWIDELDSQLPKLTNFVLPSGGLSATHINLARTICRRAERAVVPLVAQSTVDSEVGRYLNRLSDFLFVASRYASMKENRKETIWRKAQTSNEA